MHDLQILFGKASYFVRCQRTSPTSLEGALGFCLSGACPHMSLYQQQTEDSEDSLKVPSGQIPTNQMC